MRARGRRADRGPARRPARGRERLRIPSASKVRRSGPLAAEAAGALLVADLAVRLLPSPRATRLLGAPCPGPAPERAQPVTAEAARVGRAVERIAAALPWRPVCLPQAVATRWLLRRRQIPCVCHLGVIGTQPAFSAHAWVTVGERTVQGGSGARGAVEVATFA